jgi:oleate hydratase
MVAMSPLSFNVALAERSSTASQLTPWLESSAVESSWLASIVLPHQPHFIGQPADVDVFWGYGLFVDRPGDFVKKPMSACSGREIMTEIMGHLGIEAEAGKILETCTCNPCMMPFITSQFLRRGKGDRPQVIPDRSKNLAFIG